MSHFISIELCFICVYLISALTMRFIYDLSNRFKQIQMEEEESTDFHFHCRQPGPLQSLFMSDINFFCLPEGK